jgi:hypothetical protein
VETGDADVLLQQKLNGGKMPPQTDSSLTRQMLPIILGASISLISTATVTALQAYYQGRNQRKEFLVERRMTALRDFSAAINGDGELLANYSLLEQNLSVIINNPNSKDVREMLNLAAEIQREQSNYIAALKPQAIIMTSLFKIKFPVFKWGIPDLASLERLYPAKQRTKLLVQDLKKLLQDTHQFHSEFINSINDYQAILEELAKTENLWM